jgi:hypothetical protein
MTKLKLENLAVESFTTSAPSDERGTVHAFENTVQGCPDSYGGTCWLSCWETCGCDTETFC